MDSIQRRSFLRLGAVSAVAAVIPGSLFGQEVMSDSTRPMSGAKSRDRGPQLEDGMVQEFVRRAHFDLPYVQQAVGETPSLLYASWDLGGGDFETGLGGASHVGDREIALFLLEKGARPDLFTMVMLGQTEVVRGLITAVPALINCKGPHGLSLVHHAKKGGSEASAVLEFLVAAGAEA